MAIIKCPQCGKEVSSRTEKCPYCNKVLIEVEKHESVSVETITQTAKENSINIIVSSVLVLLVFLIGNIITKLMVSTFLGSNGAEAIAYANKIGLSKIMIFTLIGVVFYCVLPLLFKQKPDIGFASGIIITILLCLICFAVQSGEIEKGLIEIGRPDLIAYSMSYAKFNGLFVFMLQGALAILSYGNKTKKFFVTAIILLVAYMIVYAVLGFVFVAVLQFGVFGFSLVQLIGGIAVFVIAIIKSNELKKMLHK